MWCRLSAHISSPACVLAKQVTELAEVSFRFEKKLAIKKKMDEISVEAHDTCVMIIFLERLVRNVAYPAC